MGDTTAITNLLFRYAELIDRGDFAGIGALFAHARIVIGDGPDDVTDGAGIQASLEAGTIRYDDDGTPHTKHVTTNAIVEVDGTATTATSRSYYTVLQQVGDTPLHPIICGRYHDRFALVDGAWRFTERDYRMVDLIGELGDHLRFTLPR